jgi:hypothetical protein
VFFHQGGPRLGEDALRAEQATARHLTGERVLTERLYGVGPLTGRAHGSHTHWMGTTAASSRRAAGSRCRPVRAHQRPGGRPRSHPAS